MLRGSSEMPSCIRDAVAFALPPCSAVQSCSEMESSFEIPPRSEVESCSELRASRVVPCFACLPACLTTGHFHEIPNAFEAGHGGSGARAA